MPDITMCTGDVHKHTCPRRQTCYRYAANPGIRQAYFETAPLTVHYQEGRYACQYYWPYPEEEEDESDT